VRHARLELTARPEVAFLPSLAPPLAASEVEGRRQYMTYDPGSAPNILPPAASAFGGAGLQS